MFLGRVVGTLVPATICEGLEGVPLLCVQPLDKRGEPKGRPSVCADGTRMAGPDEMIYWEASREAALTLDPWFVPVDHAVVGIVDGLQLDGGGAMILGRVRGRIYSTIHHSIVEGQKLLIVDKLDAAGEPTGGYLIAMDSVGAGAGETVLVLDEGNGARQILGDASAPVRSMVVGIVDDLEAS